MNSKNIPTDIKNKSIDKIRKEISEIVDLLEKEASLENSIDNYNRLISLNKYIEQKFKDKYKKISQKNIKNTQKSFLKN